MNPKEILDIYINTIKTKYICFDGDGSQKEFISFIIVWIAGAIALGIVSVILGMIGIGFIGVLLCSLWNLANLLPGIGTLIRFLKSKNAE